MASPTDIDDWAVPRRTAAHAMDASDVLSVYVVLLMLFPSTLVVEPLGAAGSLAGLFGVGLLLWWLATRLLPDHGRGGRPAVRRAVGFLTMTFTISYGLAALRGLDGVEQNAADRGMLALLGVIGPCLVALDGLEGRGDLIRLIRRLTTLGAIMGAVGWIQSLSAWTIRPVYSWIPLLSFNSGESFVFESTVTRVASTAGHPIEFGMVMVLLMPFALHQALHAPVGRRLGRWLVVGFIALGIPASVSRSAFVGIAAAAVVLVIAWPQLRTRRALAAFVPSLVAIRLMAPGTLGTIRSGFLNLGNDPSVEGRTEDYEIVGQFIRGRPFFGRGYWTFLPDRYVLLDNQIIGAVIEVGFVGLAALLGLLGTASVVALTAGRRLTTPAARQLGAAFVATFFAAVVGMGTFDALGYAQFSGLLFLLVGCAGAYGRLPVARSERPSTRSVPASPG